MVHVTLEVDANVLKAGKDRGLVLSHVFERALKIELGLENELKLLLKEEEDLKVKLALLEQKKIILTTKRLETQTSINEENNAYENDIKILKKSFINDKNDINSRFPQVLQAFCTKYGVDRKNAIDYLTGKIKVLKHE